MAKPRKNEKIDFKPPNKYKGKKDKCIINVDGIKIIFQNVTTKKQEKEKK